MTTPHRSGASASTPGVDADEALLDIRGLTLTLDGTARRPPAALVRDMSIAIRPGEVFGLVGETGAGKSLTAWSTVDLLPRGIRRTAGSIVFGGRDLAACSEAELRSVRGSQIAMIVQNPKAALLPTRTVGDQLALAHRVHSGSSRKASREAAIEAIAGVGLGDARHRADAYPHQLSGGQAQRIVVAMALINDPRLIIADEPTTGLDVTVQAAVLDLMAERARERGAALWIITHDLGIVANYATTTTVMFAGECVESSTTREVFTRPAHPYTAGLLAAVTGDAAQAAEEKLVVSGPAPQVLDRADGCQFAYRCPHRIDACGTPIPLTPAGPEHAARCIRTGEIRKREEVANVS